MFGELVVWYLFLGGAAGGACLARLFVGACARRAQRGATGSLASESEEEELWARFDAAVSRPTLLAATLCATVGCVCLLGDMVRPEQAHLLFVSPSFSVLSVGSFILALFLLTLFALVAADIFLPRVPRWALRALNVLAAVLACATVAYTGVYLNSIWTVGPWNSGFLVPLFIFSSLASGVAVPLVVVGVANLNVREYRRQLKVLSIIDMACIAGELLSLAGMFWQLGAGEAGSTVSLFLTGGLGAQFLFGFIGCGLVVPLVLDGLQLWRRVVGVWHGIVVGLCTLAGAFFLRSCVIGVAFAYRALALAAIGV